MLMPRKITHNYTQFQQFFWKKTLYYQLMKTSYKHNWFNVIKTDTKEKNQKRIRKDHIWNILHLSMDQI